VDNPAIRWDVVNNDRTIVRAATASLLQRLHRMFRDRALSCSLEKDHIVVEESFVHAVSACQAELEVVLLKGERRPV
jgi:hypothetical protein